jgi:hypothetical protein
VDEAGTSDTDRRRSRRCSHEHADHSPHRELDHRLIDGIEFAYAARREALVALAA